MRKIIYAVIVIISMCCTVTFAEKHWATLYIEQLYEKQIIDSGRIYAPEDYITRKEFVAMALKAVSAKPGEVSRYFSDVDENDSFSGYITLAYELGIVSGYSDRTFRPDATLKREEAAVILSRVFGFLPGYSLAGEYKDSDEVTPAAMSAIAYANRKKIINGYPDGTFGATNLLTREEMAVMLYRVLSKQMKIEILTETKSTLKDFDEVSDFAKTSVSTLNTSGIISGDDSGNFNPKANATRAEVCQMIYNALNREGGRI